jgi:DNA-binding GntR family transcriptional regulator
MFKQLPSVQTRLADDVYEQILGAILSGHIGPGERIVQEKIAAEINVSRTPVREALLRLEQEGILEISGRAGFTIRKIGEDEVRQIYQAREAVEGYAARLLAESANAAQLQRLGGMIAREEQLSSQNVEDYFHANKRIHRAIVAETHNRYMLDQFDGIWNRGISYRLFAAIDTNELKQSLSAHHLLIDAIGSGAPGEAQQAMIDHIRDGLGLQLKALAP